MAGAVTVRMYNIGFGDAFLLSVPVAGGIWRMLVDCGVHSQGRSEHDIDDVVADIIATAADPTGRARLDVVVGTHRHRDHVLGFEDDRWAEVEVGEVWLPWVEDPADIEATSLREVHDAAAFALHQSFAAADSAKAELALTSLTNERAMWTLRHGFAGTPTRRYVDADLELTHDVSGLPGAGVRFLGPPRDEASIRAMNPPQAAALVRATRRRGRRRWGGVPAGVRDRPGDTRGAVPAPGPAPDARRAARAGGGRRLRRDDLAGPLGQQHQRDLPAAVGSARLLFPGDAQWGAWRGLLETPAIRALLSQVNMYKISHHGSHNGTPTELAREVLSGSVTSLLSVRSIPRWSEVPKGELVDELAEPGRLVLRSAEPAPQPTRRHPAGLWVEHDVAI